MSNLDMGLGTRIRGHSCPQTKRASTSRTARATAARVADVAGRAADSPDGCGSSCCHDDCPATGAASGSPPRVMRLQNTA